MRIFLTTLSVCSVTALMGCGATPEPVVPKVDPLPVASKPVDPPTPIAPPKPEIGKAPDLCAPFVALSARVKGDEVKAKAACADTKSILMTLGAAATAHQKGLTAARDEALVSLSRCEKLPVLVVDILRAELSPIVCAEAILEPALEAHGKEAQPLHQAAARSLVAASRFSRLRPKAGEFDKLIAKSLDDKADAAAKEAEARVVFAGWKDVLEAQENEAGALSKGAPAELRAVAHFEAARAWLGFTNEIRGMKVPPFLEPNPADDASTAKERKIAFSTYLTKLDETTQPLLDRGRGHALSGLGIGARDGILVKELAGFAEIRAPFRSRLGFEARKTRELELLIVKPAMDTATDPVRIAAALPAWAAFALLERLAPAELLEDKVLAAMAGHQGVPSVLRLEVEKDKKLADSKHSAIALSRLRTALSFGSRADAETISTWTPKEPVDKLRVTIARALLGMGGTKTMECGDGKPDTKTKKCVCPAGKIESTEASVSRCIDPKSLTLPAPDAAPTYAYEYVELDAIAKKADKIGDAAAFNAALLSLDAAQHFHGSSPDPLAKIDPKKSYERAVTRLDAVVARKGIDPLLTSRAKEFADSARESIKLLEKKP